MDSLKAEILNFINKCEEVKSCKFIMATTKLKDILKSIVNSQTLYELFTSFTQNYNYTEGKKQCLVKKYDGISNKGRVILPKSDVDRLAFIFCLLVEFDRDTINFNEFLREYFSDDGSYYASYYAFCETIITNLEETVKKLFADEMNKIDSAPEEQKPQQSVSNLAKMLSVISLLIAHEKQYILESAIPKEDKEAGYKMLNEIYNSLKERKISTANSLVCGYNYYILYNNVVSENVQTLFESIEEYERAL